LSSFPPSKVFPPGDDYGGASSGSGCFGIEGNTFDLFPEITKGGVVPEGAASSFSFADAFFPFRGVEIFPFYFLTPPECPYTFSSLI